MNTIQEQLLAQLNWRYATKQFDPEQKISPTDWATLQETLVLTPSSFGVQPWRFIVVNDPVLREKLVSASWNQRQVVDASHLVVFAVQKNFGEKEIEANVDLMAQVRGIPRESLTPLRDMMHGSLVAGMDADTRRNWATHQVYIALGNLLTSAALLGIDACPMEGFVRAQYDAILDLDKHGLSAVVVCPLGYRASTDKYSAYKKVRFPKEELILNI
jgi:nitroreductase